jgi:anti-anti-sigma regulatory factor
MHELKKEAVTRKLVFRDDLSAARFEWMRDYLAEALVASDIVELELMEVNQVDDALIQLICGAHRVADSLGKTLALSTEETRKVLYRLAKNTGYATDPCRKRDRGCLYRETPSGKGRKSKR